MTSIQTQDELIALCTELVEDLTCLTAAELRLVKKSSQVMLGLWDLERVRDDIRRGEDPLGDAFSSIRSPAERRALGAVYTPRGIVDSMIRWVGREENPVRIVDPGAGSGRFLIAAGAAFPNAKLVAVELDPMAALMLRANLAARGWADRTTVLVQDFREITLPDCLGITAFVGNPPYVRHHDIGEEWKRWYTETFARLGIKASALAGLHLHFFLKTRLLAKPGDIGTFITSAEWLDVNYGAALRRLLKDQLGGVALHVLDPETEAFPGTATTAAITCFRVGETKAPLRVRAVTKLPQLNGLTKGTDIPRASLDQSARWSVIIRPAKTPGVGEMELGELFRVHRGQVTGLNEVWVADVTRAAMLPERTKLPTITKAKDLIEAGACLRSTTQLRRVIDLPPCLDGFTAAERQGIDDFLRWAKSVGADQGYIARHRKAWWSVGLKEPAPILCTYMARRAPQFTINACGARHINIAHGLYPREPLPGAVIARFVRWLNQNIRTEDGRTYAGGLTKFEPKEIERLRVPLPKNLPA